MSELRSYRCRFVHRGHERVVYLDGASAGTVADHLLEQYGRGTRILKVERAEFTEERFEQAEPGGAE